MHGGSEWTAVSLAARSGRPPKACFRFGLSYQPGADWVFVAERNGDRDALSRRWLAPPRVPLASGPFPTLAALQRSNKASLMKQRAREYLWNDWTPKGRTRSPSDQARQVNPPTRELVY